MITVSERITGGSYNIDGDRKIPRQPLMSVWVVAVDGERIDSFLSRKNAVACAKRLPRIHGHPTIIKNTLMAYMSPKQASIARCAV